MSGWAVVSALFAVYVLAKAYLLVQAKFSQGDLDRVAPVERPWPRLSVVVAARNEARGIEAALRSIFALDYPNLEFIVVDDRSTDGTSEILARLAAEFPALKIIRVDELPPDWLGKNYALDLGARAAVGELVLFCDADVVFGRDCLKRAVMHFLDERLDHLCLLIRVWSRSFWVDGFIPFFGQNLMLYFRPWEAKNPRKKHRYMGVGAFNLLRRRVLAELGYLERIPLRPDDDVKLGKLIKQSGFRQDCLIAVRQASVEWYATLRECVQGLEKNAFSGTDYRVGLIVAGVLGTLAPTVVPLAVLGWGPVGAKLLVVGAYAVDVGLAALSARMMGTPLDRLLLHPVGNVLFAGILVRTTWKNLRDGGLVWRDTFYPLERLKKNVV